MRLKPRYSLRVFLLFVTFCVMVVGLFRVFYLEPIRAEYLALEHFRQLGGQVVTKAREPKWLWGWLDDEFAREGLSLMLDRTDVNDTDLKLLAALPKLKGLYVDQTAVTDDCLDAIESCHELDALCMRYTHISRPPRLTGMTKLQELDLAFTDIQSIDLTGLLSLESINVRGTLVSDDSLATFANHPNLKTIDIAGSPARVHITDVGLDRLTNLPRLSTIYLYGIKPTAAGITRLRQRFPNVAVVPSPKTTYASKASDEE